MYLILRENSTFSFFTIKNSIYWNSIWDTHAGLWGRAIDCRLTGLVNLIIVAFALYSLSRSRSRSAPSLPAIGWYLPSICLLPSFDAHCCYKLDGREELRPGYPQLLLNVCPTCSLFLQPCLYWNINWMIMFHWSCHVVRSTLLMLRDNRFFISIIK